MASEGAQRLDIINTLQEYSNVVVISSDYGFNSFNFFRKRVLQLNLQPFSPFLSQPVFLSIRDDCAEVIQLSVDEQAENLNPFTVRFSTRSRKQLDRYYRHRDIVKIGEYMLENHAEL